MKKLIGVMVAMLGCILAIDSGRVPIDPRFNPMPAIGEHITAIEAVGHELWIERMNAHTQR